MLVRLQAIKKQASNRQGIGSCASHNKWVIMVEIPSITQWFPCYLLLTLCRADIFASYNSLGV
jgi:hypothetical protein